MTLNCKRRKKTVFINLSRMLHGIGKLKSNGTSKNRRQRLKCEQNNQHRTNQLSHTHNSQITTTTTTNRREERTHKKCIESAHFV